ncbi:MAG: DUF1801 domain-containing protein [Bacteroidota bacterium]
MQYSASNPQEFLACLDQDWRKETLVEIRKLILDQGLKEIIEYKMLAFRDQEKTIFHLNAQKNYVSLYVGDHKKVDPSGALLKGLNMGKGCIRFKNTSDLSQSKIKEFIKETIKISSSGGDVGC